MFSEVAVLSHPKIEKVHMVDRVGQEHGLLNCRYARRQAARRTGCPVKFNRACQSIRLSYCPEGAELDKALQNGRLLTGVQLSLLVVLLTG